MARIIDADMFLLALIYHGSIDNEKCGWIADTIEKCKVEVFTKDEVIAILENLQLYIDGINNIKLIQEKIKAIEEQK